MNKRQDRSPSPAAVWMVLILLLAFFLRVIYLTHDRFHADEALYAGWALRILDDDPLLLQQPVDKPPLYLYTLAAAFRIFGYSEIAARWPNLACSLLNVVLLCKIATRIRKSPPHAPLWTALFLALSPFELLFARTCFTDTMLLTWTLAALNAVMRKRWFWTGLSLGLAFATKQHGLIVIPLVFAAGLIQVNSVGLGLETSAHNGKKHAYPPPHYITRLLLAALGFGIIFALVMWWDSARWMIRPGFWDQSSLSYGGLTWAPLAEWGTRLAEWLAWSRYLFGSTGLALLFVGGTAVLLVDDWKNDPSRSAAIDTLWASFILLYLLLHTIIQFSIWDRYLLPLTIPVALLWARMLSRLSSLASRTSHLTLALILILALSGGIRAAVNGYPIGGEHWAYQGLDEIATYLKTQTPPHAVLYHHWLRWHYTYYLAAPQPPHERNVAAVEVHGPHHLELRWWRNAEHLRQEARKSPNRVQYLVLPDWHTLDPRIEGLHLVPVLETRRKDGSLALTLYRIELVNPY